MIWLCRSDPINFSMLYCQIANLNLIGPTVRQICDVYLQVTLCNPHLSALVVEVLTIVAIQVHVPFLFFNN